MLESSNKELGHLGTTVQEVL